jgi:UDP-3-O-[3-hydroxymyristoyl] glucosamine N-acyltransferase
MLTLRELAQLCDAELQGNPQCEIMAVAPISEAQQGTISFISEKKYQAYLTTTQASAIILPHSLATQFSGNKLLSYNPYLAYAKAVTALFPKPDTAWNIHPSAVIHPNAIIADEVAIAAHAVIEAGCEIKTHAVIGAACYVAEHCVIGAKSELKARVTLHQHTQLGQNCLIHSGAVLGADGFGFAPQKTGEWYKIPQIGQVILGDHVEVGANTCIDRAALGVTRISNGVKLDNLIQIGHNVSIGEHTAIAAQTAIAGSVTIGKRCRIAGMVAIAGHLHIADDIMITGTTLVSHNLYKAGVYSSGTVADENIKWRKNVARFRKLDDLYRKVIKLEKYLLKGKKQ